MIKYLNPQVIQGVIRSDDTGVIRYKMYSKLQKIDGFLYHRHSHVTISRADARSRPRAMSAVALLTTPGVLVTFTPRLLMYGTSKWLMPAPPLATTFRDGSKRSSEGSAAGLLFQQNKTWTFGLYSCKF